MSLTKAPFRADHRGYGQDPLSIMHTSTRIQQILGQQLCKDPGAECELADRVGHENCAEILHYYGKRPFKCKFPRCEFWRQGFEDRTSKTQHERSHENAVKCHVPGCKFEKIGFLSEKMRQKHIQEGHLSDLPQPKLDASELKKDSVRPLLHYLVAENRVEEVRDVLSDLSNPYAYGFFAYGFLQFRLLASFMGSPAMLKLFEKHTDQYCQRLCVTESIKGRNEMTMAHNLASLQEPMVSNPRTSEEDIFFQILSRGWLEGLKLWCKASRKQLEGRHIGNKKNPEELVGSYLFDPRVLRIAAKGPAGEEALLFLWRESGLVSYITDIPRWANRTLRNVVISRCSVALATELLSRGADVNWQPNFRTKTALHCAVERDSAEGAEMIRFLLLRGGDPEAFYIGSRDRDELETKKGKAEENRKYIRDEKGAKNICKWLGKSWNELVGETKHIRYEEQVRESLEPKGLREPGF